MAVYGKKQGHHCYWLTKDGESLANFDKESEVDAIIRMQDDLQNAVNERNQAWFELEEKQTGQSFQGIAEATKIEGFDMIAVNGDGVVISTDNVKPNAAELDVGKRYEITIKLA
jgi:hypothetical protein